MAVMSRFLAAAALACGLSSGQVRVIVSSSAGDRLAEKPALQFSATAGGLPAITVDPATRFQTVEGIGATLNEAGLMVLNKLPAAEQEKVLRALFDEKSGAGFTLMKTPLAACDFAAAGPWFTYADTPGDVALKHFTISRDLQPNGMLTFIRRARRYGAFKIQSTTDYPPDWILDAKMSLKPEYYPVFAEYLARSVEAYAREGVTVDFLSPFNEPQYIYCKITYSEIRDLVKNHLGPLFRKRGFPTRLQLCDANNRMTGQRDFPKVLDDPQARRYISTMTVHGYSWEKETSAPMARLHERYPDIPVWQTEVCYAKVIDKRPMPVFGFEDGDRWGRMLIADFNNWGAGWIYWNAILDHKGGPWLVSEIHHDPADNPQHAVVIIDTDKREPVYTGLYYYLAHFSRYVRPGAVRVASSGSVADVSYVAFQDPSGRRILEVVNSAAAEREFVIRDGSRSARASLPGRSIGTFLWN